MATKNLDELLADAQARVAELKKKQRAKEAREATKIGKRLHSKIGEGRESFTAEFKLIRDELFPPESTPDETREQTTEATWGGGHHGE
ncbi:hypothetical protein SAMN04488550_2923 [Gordonia malaquae]|uniref:Uncharacterized protein n=1 Tax=Gordonia malaquae NBRC 108250 TaxID=1223542 RepID=M3UHF9_GORML|nr:hypothetical protein [Gordonia malaquae]GAC78795.1 hypothetical protein GM1_004_02400 [Gordonia malaquae NBRC 108250]SED66554.1 hypothetical protein SAMN04488550_2923 [Gordonia malaquae]